MHRFLIVCLIVFAIALSVNSLSNVSKYFSDLLEPLQESYDKHQSIQMNVTKIDDEIANIQTLLKHTHTKMVPGDVEDTFKRTGETKDQVVTLLEGLLKKLQAERKTLLAFALELKVTVEKYERFSFLNSVIVDSEKEITEREKCI